MDKIDKTKKISKNIDQDVDNDVSSLKSPNVGQLESELKREQIQSIDAALNNTVNDSGLKTKVDSLLNDVSLHVVSNIMNSKLGDLNTSNVLTVDSIKASLLRTYESLSSLGQGYTLVDGSIIFDIPMTMRKTYPTLLDVVFDRFSYEGKPLHSNIRDEVQTTINVDLQQFVKQLDDNSEFQDYSRMRFVLQSKNCLYDVRHDPYNYELPRDKYNDMFKFRNVGLSTVRNTVMTGESTDRNILALYCLDLAIRMSKTCDYVTQIDALNDLEVIKWNSIVECVPKFTNLPFIPSFHLRSVDRYKLSEEIIDAANGQNIDTFLYSPRIITKEKQGANYVRYDIATTGDLLSQELQDRYMRYFFAMNNPIETILEDINQTFNELDSRTARLPIDFASRYFHFRMATDEERQAANFRILMDQDLLKKLYSANRSYLSSMAGWKPNMIIFEQCQTAMSIKSQRFTPIYSTLAGLLPPIEMLYDFIATLSMGSFVGIVPFDVVTTDNMVTQTTSIEKILKLLSYYVLRFFFPQIGSVLFDNYLIWLSARTFPNANWGFFHNTKRFMASMHQTLVLAPARGTPQGGLFFSSVSNDVRSRCGQVHRLTGFQPRKDFSLPEVPNPHGSYTANLANPARLELLLNNFSLVLTGFAVGNPGLGGSQIDQNLYKHLLSMLQLLHRKSLEICEIAAQHISPYMDRLFRRPLSAPVCFDSAPRFIAPSIGTVDTGFIQPPMLVKIDSFSGLGLLLLLGVVTVDTPERQLPNYQDVMSDFMSAQHFFKESAAVCRFRNVVNLINTQGLGFPGINRFMSIITLPATLGRTYAWLQFFKDSLSQVGEPVELMTTMAKAYSNAKMDGNELRLQALRADFLGNNQFAPTLVSDIPNMDDRIFGQIDLCCEFLNKNFTLLFPRGGGLTTSNSTMALENRYFNFETDLDWPTDPRFFIIDENSIAIDAADDGIDYVFRADEVTPIPFDINPYVRPVVLNNDVVIGDYNAILIFEKPEKITKERMNHIKTHISLHHNWTLYFPNVITMAKFDYRLGLPFHDGRDDSLLDSLKSNVMVPANIRFNHVLNPNNRTAKPPASKLGTVTNRKLLDVCTLSTFGFAKEDLSHEPFLPTHNVAFDLSKWIVWQEDPARGVIDMHGVPFDPLGISFGRVVKAITTPYLITTPEIEISQMLE